ncbi:helix-turn-helix transcriptional regulator [Paramicrobacterium agarici]|uniref:Excisionase family DNA binding protein n=1 Tax=Paramicrobacterium agarici TaxID=630514 RepID=A0A2A9DZ10_9MICO|nr:helix-turn-helix domain-containing protein [Microbacterium agarici]PFG31169.1 excisionase family DNA binding protein [Microbacterium agarici]
MTLTSPSNHSIPPAEITSHRGEVKAQQTAAASYELPDLLTIDDLAAYLRVSKQTIYHWRKTGGGPVGHYLGKHLRFAKPDIDAWRQSLPTTRELTRG